jgi:hypothetical protein
VDAEPGSRHEHRSGAGLAPTSQPVEVDVFDVGRFENDKMVEHWGVADQLGLLLQAGFDPRRLLAPTPEGATR